MICSSYFYFAANSLMVTSYNDYFVVSFSIDIKNNYVFLLACLIEICLFLLLSA